MRAGRLNQRVTFQRKSGVLDAHGTEDQDAWSDMVTVWAGVEPISGREFFASRQTLSEITTRIVCRYSSEISGVTTKDRIQHGTRILDIRSIINPNSRGVELQFMCTEHEG